ncbi:DUF1963 domain-containing protein [Patulibacter sp.]|uniref:DUF1963 domain-containing protein n=1 Tax=Patulibacter sp. TaxID=1912859 RepID=UPI002725B189|nr:DUF1963 domain-containing protein [Patulibacter sp.]MDO9408312.1 DUF1963 domain-containing protein [Patulibacter sp.]
MGLFHRLRRAASGEEEGPAAATAGGGSVAGPQTFAGLRRLMAEGADTTLQRAEIERVLVANGVPGSVAARSVASMVDGVALLEHGAWPELAPAPGCRLGGEPLLPAGASWPLDRTGRPLTFVAVLDLADLPPVSAPADGLAPADAPAPAASRTAPAASGTARPASGFAPTASGTVRPASGFAPTASGPALPASGVLLVFWDQAFADAPEIDFVDATRVFSVADPTGLESAGAPDGTQTFGPVALCPVRMPFPATDDGLGGDALPDGVPIDELRAALREEQGHRLLGVSHDIQGPVLDEVAYWLREGTAGTRSRYTEAELAGEGWALLAQVDETSGLVLGDAGALYLVLPRADLDAGRFDRVMGIMQC